MTIKNIIVRYCVHCCNTTPQELVYQQNYDEIDEIAETRETIYLGTITQYIVSCQTCHKLSIYHGHLDYDDDGEEVCENIRFRHAHLIWPKLMIFDEKILSRKLYLCYQDALKIKSINPVAFVIQIRLALEIICIEQGVKEKTLHSSLLVLAESGKLPPLLTEVSFVLKTIGNTGAHDVNMKITAFHAVIVDEFFKTIVEYLYVAPYNLNKFQNALDKLKAVNH